MSKSSVTTARQRMPSLQRHGGDRKKMFVCDYSRPGQCTAEVMVVGMIPTLDGALLLEFFTRGTG